DRDALRADLDKANALASALRPDRSTIFVADSRGTLVPLASGPILRAAAQILDDVKTRQQATVIEEQNRRAAARGDAPYAPPRGGTASIPTRLIRRKAGSRCSGGRIRSRYLICRRTSATSSTRPSRRVRDHRSNSRQRGRSRRIWVTDRNLKGAPIMSKRGSTT